jgi:hypothetical protein
MSKTLLETLEFISVFSNDYILETMLNYLRSLDALLDSLLLDINVFCGNAM